MSEHRHANILLVGTPGRRSTTLSLRLRELGHRVSVHDEWRHALKDLFEEDFELLLLQPNEDPDEFYFNLCERLRERALTSSLPIVFLLGERDRLSRLKAFRRGADDVIDDEIASDELDARIQSLLRMGRRQRAMASDLGRLRAALATLDAAVMVIDEDGMVREANARAHSMLGLDADILSLHGVDRILAAVGVARPSIERVLTAHERVEEEVVARIHGDERILRIRCERLLGSVDGRPTWCAVLEDVTDQRGRDRQQADFHSMIAHDLRNPISVIQGYVQLMGGEDPGVELDEIVERVALKVEDVSRLLDDFLDFSMLEAGFLRLRPDRLDLDLLLEESVRDVEIVARQRGNVIGFRIDEAAREIPVDADAQRLRQVLLNLLTNALKYGGETAPIEIDVTPLESGIRVSVTDRGPGIPPHEQPIVFERYQRARRDLDDGRGIGLGLVIVRKIVEAHGGRVGLESVPGQGCTFYFELPAATETVGQGGTAHRN